MVFTYRSVFERFNCKRLLYSVTANRVREKLRTVCVNAAQKNAKLKWLNGLLTITEHQKFLEDGKFIVGAASVACVVSHRCLIFTVWFS